MRESARHRTRLWIAALCAFGWVAVAVPARGASLVGVSFSDSYVYDVDANTGAATNPRPVTAPYPCTIEFCPGGSIYLSLLAGVETLANGSLVFATVEVNTFYPSTLFSAATASPGNLEPIGPVGEQVGEGDLARDPLSGDLFAVGLTGQIAPFTLLRIHVTLGGLDPIATTVVGVIGNSDVSALGFDANGTLYALDTGMDQLLVLDPSDASTLSTMPLSTPLGAVAGMDFDPETGTFYVADGGNGGTNKLYTLDPATGALAAIGPLGIADGLSGLAVVPEPGAALLGIAACAALAGVAARRG